jgi:hypothetical protein
MHLQWNYKVSIRFLKVSATHRKRNIRTSFGSLRERSLNQIEKFHQKFYKVKIYNELIDRVFPGPGPGTRKFI